MLQVSIGSNYSDDDSTHESGSREGRGERASGRRESEKARKKKWRQKSEEREEGESNFVISGPFAKILLQCRNNHCDVI